MKTCLSVLAMVSVLSTPAYAQEADALLKSLGNVIIGQAKDVPATDMMQAHNPVARQLMAELLTSQGLSFEIQNWSKGFLKEDYRATAHLWSAIQKNAPASFLSSMKGAYLYSLYKIGGLDQTFFNEWLSSRQDQAFSQSRSAYALEESVSPELEKFLIQKKISFSPEQAAYIQSLPETGGYSVVLLKAHTLIRKGMAAQGILEKLRPDSQYRALLGQTVALAQARNHQIAEAAKTLKTYYEPWMNQQSNAEVKSKYVLQIARLLYQIESLDGAEAFYSKVPRGSPDYLTAQEELGWVWLRKGSQDKLRGLVESFHSGLFKDHFMPEIRVLEAISDLKLCKFPKVTQVMDAYVKENKDMAKTVDEALAKQESVKPDHIDDMTADLETQLRLRTSEKALLDTLADESVQAALPSVGKQQHWVKAGLAAQNQVEASKKNLAGEYRRLWKLRQGELVEANRKMQFVRAELLSQTSQLKAQAGDVPTPESAKVKPDLKAQMVFPYDGVIWPDEVLKLRAATESECHKLHSNL